MKHRPMNVICLDQCYVGGLNKFIHDGLLMGDSSYDIVFIL